MQDQRKVQGRHTLGATGQSPPSVHRMLHSFLFSLVTGSSFPPSFSRKVSLVCRGLSHEFPFHLPEILHMLGQEENHLKVEALIFIIIPTAP